MSKRLLRLAAAWAIGALLAAPAFAFPQLKPSPPKAPPKPAAGATSVTGPVKGAPNGNTFVVARKAGPVTVDAAGARFRDSGGRFTNIAAVKPGTMVTAKGTMNGTNLKATEVTVHLRGGSKPAPPKPGAPKTTPPKPK